jgi:DNA processing protein
MSTAHWVALSMIPGIGGTTARKLVERFGTVEAVFEADQADLLAVRRVTPDIARQIRNIRFKDIEAELASLDDEGITVVTPQDDGYPELLRTAGDAPSVLFVRGQVRPADTRAVAIVGTREPGAQGLQTAERLASELAARGWTIVSGLALGIDTAAHRGALAAPGGRTLAVLGSGLRVVHPCNNADLAQEIIARGALLSELHPSTPPRGPQLMARDRIISGLSRAVIVVEAGEKSGSLDTASKAHKQGRPVLAVPGSPGTDQLIAFGATPVQVEQEDWGKLVALVEQLPGMSTAPDIPQQVSLW